MSGIWGTVLSIFYPFKISCSRKLLKDKQRNSFLSLASTPVVTSHCKKQIYLWINVRIFFYIQRVSVTSEVTLVSCGLEMFCSAPVSQLVACWIPSVSYCSVRSPAHAHTVPDIWRRKAPPAPHLFQGDPPPAPPDRPSRACGVSGHRNKEGC